MKKDLTTGKPWKVLLLFALPYLFSSFMQTFYGLVDLYVVGQYNGAASSSGVAIGSQLMHMVTVVIIGLTMGSTIRIGNAVGKKDEREVRDYISQTILIFSVIALVLTILLTLNLDGIVKVMSTPKEAIGETKSYLWICFLGIPFIIAYNVISNIFRGLGDSKTPMYIVAMACVINVILDYVLVGAFHMGASGTAVATVTAQGVSSVIAAIYAWKRNVIHIERNEFVIRKREIKHILGSGVPIALQDGFIQISFLVITIIANRRGLIPATSVGIVEKFIGFLFLVPSALLSALSAIVAQNIGAGQKKRAKEMLYYSLALGITFGLSCAIICQFIPEVFVGLFTSNQEVIESGSQYLRGYSWDCLMASIHFCFSGYFCGCNRSSISFIHNTISILTVRIPGAYLTSLLFPATLLPMGLAIASGSLLSAIICLLFYLGEDRRVLKK